MLALEGPDCQHCIVNGMEVNPQLVEQMKAFARRGVKFEQAKSALLDAGWGERELMAAAEQFPYTTGAENSDGAVAGLDAAQAQAYGKAMLGAEVEDEQEDFQKDAAQAEFGLGRTSRFEHQDTFAMYDLAIPWWLFYPGMIGLVVIAVWLRLPRWAVLLFVVVVAALRAWQRYPRWRGPKQ